jgi:magnesium transporter
VPAQTVVRRLVDGALVTGDIGELEGLAPNEAVWIDVVHVDEAELKRLAALFGVDDLVVHRVLHPNGHARLEAHADGLELEWVVVGGFGDSGVTKHPFAALLLGNGLLTLHRAELPLFDEVAGEAAELLAQGADRVLCRLLDGSIDTLLARAAEIETALDAIADSLVEPEDEARRDRVARLGDVKQAPRRIQQQRRRLLDLRRVVVPERDALRRMLRRGTLSEDTFRRLQDVGDALTRVEEDIQTGRDVATNIVDMYLSAVSNNMNLVMKRLTIVATIFMPGTLIVGIYGMNFHIPELAWSFGYAWALFLILAVTGGMLVFFRWRRWL